MPVSHTLIREQELATVATGEVVMRAVRPGNVHPAQDSPPQWTAADAQGHNQGHAQAELSPDMSS